MRVRAAPDGAEEAEEAEEEDEALCRESVRRNALFVAEDAAEGAEAESRATRRG